MAESNQLESLPLSALSADDSGPPQVTYGSEQPLTASTPRATLTSIPEMQTTETYCQIIPGMSDHLYPTLVADGSLSTHIPDNHDTLQNQITSEIDQYLQEAVERHERDVNHFDGQHVDTNTSSLQQKLNSVEQDEKHDEIRVLESNDYDTCEKSTNHTEHDIQYQDELETILEEEEDKDPQMAGKQDLDNLDMIAYIPDKSEEEPFNTAIDDTSEDTAIVMGRLVTTAFISDDIHIPTEKVGCLQVTSQLQEFLNHFPPESKKRPLNRYTKYYKC